MKPLPSGEVLSVGLFLGMLICLELGYRKASRRYRMDSTAHDGIGAIEAAVFALLGLLLGFAFAGAMSRLDMRRELIMREANAIGTAYLRLDLMPTPTQPEMRLLFRDYLGDRMLFYDSRPGPEAADLQIKAAARLQNRIWTLAVTASHLDPTQNTTRLLLPALNEMIDITTARAVALQTHLPLLILLLLVTLALLSALLAGYAMSKRKKRSLLHMLLYAASVSVTVYTILDLDDPRRGLIRLDSTERVLQQLHDSIR